MTTIIRPLVLLALAGCVGGILDPAAPPTPAPPRPSGGGGAPGPSMVPPAATAGAQAPGRLRRLTAAQYRSTLADLLGDGLVLGDLEPDSLRDGFASVGASYTTISARGLEQYDTAARAVAHQVFSDPARRARVLGCQPAGPDEPCVRAFLSGFGRRAWRRPLGADELDDYAKATLDAARLLGDANLALEQVLAALLSSPNFLYRIETGARGPDGRFRYTGWELASRMSYLLWNSTPDEALLAAAEAGQLDAPAGLRAQAARLLQSPRARTGFSQGFGRDLLWLDALPGTPKNDARFTPGLRAAMEAEALRLFESRLDPGSDLLDLLVTTRTFVDPELATLYGLPRPAAPGPADLPPGGPRAGLLGTAAFLSLYSAQDRTSPTARGVFVREKLLCQPVPEPPDDVNITLPTGNLTTRQRLEQHRQNPACKACHEAFDPVGFAFESFDWIGAHRDREGGLPIDSTGDLDGFTFSDARGLASRLRELPAVRDCLLRTFFRVTNGHVETGADQAALDGWTAAFEKASRSLPAFLVELVASDGFRVVSDAP